MTITTELVSIDLILQNEPIFHSYGKTDKPKKQKMTKTNPFCCNSQSMIRLQQKSCFPVLVVPYFDLSKLRTTD